MRPTLRQIAGAFIRYTNTTFGGGSATTAVLHRAIVDDRHWVPPERIALIYALARLTPGTNLLALCTGLGWQWRGWRGALIALLAASVPCSVIVVIVTFFFEQWSHIRLVEVALRGAVAAAVGITVVTCWTISKPYLKSRGWPRAALIGGAACALAVFLDIHPIRILLGAAVLGLLWPPRPA
jgi:chromate transporter